MDLNCKLIEKTFKSDDGSSHSYSVLVFKLADNSELEVTIKGDKAKLLRLSNNVNTNMPDDDFWKK